MAQLTTQLAAMFEIDGKSWTLIVLITLIAAYVIRSHANIFQTLFFLPLAVLITVVINHAFVLLQVYQPEKVAEWMVWMIVAATLGNLAGLGVMAGLARRSDRDPSAVKI